MPLGIQRAPSARRQPRRRAAAAGRAPRPRRARPRAAFGQEAFAALLGPDLGLLMGAAVLVTDLEGVIAYCGGEVQELLGSGPEELVGSDVATTVLADVERAVLARAIHELGASGSWQGELALGPQRAPLCVRATLVHDPAGRPSGYAAVLAPAAHPVAAPARDAQEAEFWQRALDALPGRALVLDEHGVIVAVSESWQQFSKREGGAGGVTVGASYLAACEASHDPAAGQSAEMLGEMLAGTRESFELEYALRAGTERRWFKVQGERLRDGGAARVIVLHDEVTSSHRLDEHAATQAALLRQAEAAIVVTDLDYRVQSWSAGAERLYGYSAEEMVGRLAGELLAPGEEHTTLDRRALMRDRFFDGRTTVRRKDGTLLPVHVYHELVCDEEGAPVAIVGVSGDVAHGKALAREALAARNYLRAVSNSVTEAIYRIDRQGHLIDMNPVAEELLGWSAEDLHERALLDVLYGPDAEESRQLEHLLESGETMRVSDECFRTKDGRSLPVAYTVAPIAGDAAGGCVIVFADISEQVARERQLQNELETLGWIGRIREALAEDRFALHAQPIVDAHTGSVTQWELLLRMRAPADAEDPAALIEPGAFLPAAEQHGLIGELDRWVIDRAAELAAHGHALQLNLSGSSVSDPAIVAHVQSALARTGADPCSLIFEITETTLVTDERAARAFVEHMHALGCRIALDDFGTGYGTFTYLKQLPIDYLKVDIEFVRDLAQNPASRKVVEAIVSLAASFGLQTIAEGVEQQESLELLRELGVEYVQGFYLGRPAPADQRLAPR
jgi:PAS domain S-box-containing protein